MEKLYKFHWDCNRMGDVHGIFAATQDEVKAAIGKEVYFGEILGKHSEIYGPLEERDLTILTDDKDFIAKAKSFGMVPMGHNPLDHIDNCG